MKTLTQHTLVYDDDCPLCQWYSQLFIDLNMLDNQGKQAFRSLPATLKGHIDQVRSRNEIALINRQTGEVTYGIRSLLKVIGNGLPFLKPLFRFPPFVFMAGLLYSLISFNRKVILPVNWTGKSCEGSCTPSFHLGFRWAFLAITWLITSIVLWHYSALLEPLLAASSFGREFLICGGQIVFQSAILFFLRKEDTLEYLGNMMTVSLIGALLLLPSLVIGALFPAIPPLVFALVFLAVVAFMLYEHMRRMKLLGLGLTPTSTWVLYRVLVLIIITLF